MRRVFALAVVTACKVADKHAPSDDGGLDAGSIDASTAELETTIDDGPDAFSNQGQVTFRFSSNVPTAHFECRIDNETAQPCESPYSRTLGDGPHSFSVRAVDGAGGGDQTPAERLWTIDTVAPNTTLTKGPPTADNSVMAEFEFRSNEMNVTFDCSLDNAGYLPCTSGGTFGPVGDGAHSFAVRATDRAGNSDASPAVYAWSVDTSTPDTQIVSGPPAASPTTTAMFTFVSPDAGGGATFQCSLDNSGFAACTSPYTVGPVTEAQHTFAVRVRDAVGNLDPTPATRTWVVDLTPPETTILSGPTGTVPIASANITFSSNETNVTFACSLDGAPFAACTSPASFSTLAQGAHSFAVRATDAAGHDDPTPASRAWTVDTVAPDVMITAGPANGSTSGPRVSFAFTASEGVIACSFDSAAFAPCASPIAVNLPAGAHQFAVRATDAANNSTTATRSWTVACAAPDPSGAAGLLHLDDTGQTLANAVTGGAAATLGDTTAVEPTDPAPLASARFGGGLSFTSTDSDHVSWPTALAAMPNLTLELWAKPSAMAGARDLVTNSDGRIAVRVTADSPTTVHFSITIVEGGMGGQTRTVTSASVAANTWHHVLASLQEPSVRLWVDGVRTELANVHPSTSPALDELRLGGTGATAYSGALDEVWLAQTAITTDDAALARYCPL
ncbi:MAG: OmpA domain protein [Myxococcales bacterium]|nr:OmpA domain protein [Myxococcales bacterium]